MSERKNPDEELPSGRADGEHLASTTALSSSPQLLAVANAAIEAARTFPNGITASEGLARSRGNGIRDATASAALLDRMLVVGGESNGGSGGPGNGISYSHGDRSKRPSTVPAKGTPSTRIHVPRSSCDEAGEESLSAKEKLAFQSLASIDPKRRVLLSDEERAIKRQRRYAQSIAALFSRSLSRSHSCTRLLLCYHPPSGCCRIANPLHYRDLARRTTSRISRRTTPSCATRTPSSESRCKRATRTFATSRLRLTRRPTRQATRQPPVARVPPRRARHHSPSSSIGRAAVVVAGTQHWIPRCQLYTATYISPSVRPCVRACVRLHPYLSISIFPWCRCAFVCVCSSIVELLLLSLEMLFASCIVEVSELERAREALACIFRWLV